ncbi:MAG: MBL fold metallo-hydrolase [Opitutales bacterium]|jgi:ribonuclease Z|nr:MBL fold metallo-hydrolase [Opitutales bacterium]MBT5815846.1 MBL fold metallo-hydrolase [Opitutales bacterium]MBT6381716.1 MBL fold metallo-hydrolase [Opitutales bacterium]MDG2255874.1 MBL fold metallo-hydrolase [Opitutaceae bacterium]
MNKPSSPSVLIAGSGAVRAHPTRGGPCYLVTIDDQNLLFDCGRCAVHNLSRFGIPVESISETYITHLHFDHICDLPLMLLLSWNNGRSRHMPIFGPKGIGAFLENGLRQAYVADIKSRTAHGKSWDGLDWDTHEIAKEGLVRETDSFIIESLATKHAGLLNYNYRIKTPSSKIVITSDSEPDPRLIEFCRDADLMVVECSGTKEFYDTQAWGGWHMTPEDVGRIAREAGVKKVVLKHLVIESFSKDPDVSEKMAETIRSLHPDGEILVAEDGMLFDV